MKHLTLSQIEPLLPCGVTAYQENPEAVLLERFNTWLRLHNQSLVDMANTDIYQRLRRVAGESHNPFYTERVYQELLKQRGQAPQGNCEPLMPTGWNYKK